MTRPTLVFIHGFMGDPSDWDFVREQFPDHATVTPTIRAATDWSSGIKQLAEEIPHNAVLVGYSMGARLSMGLMSTIADRISGLFFVSGNPGIEDREIAGKRYQNDCRIAERIEREPRSDFLSFWYSESTVFQSLTDRVREDEIRRKSARGDDDWATILRCFSVGLQPNYWPALPDMKVPFWAIAGMADLKYTNIILKMGRVPQITPRVVPHCGHIVHREQPHVFVTLLRRFLATHGFN